MEQITDKDLTCFERNGAIPLPADGTQGHVCNNGARIWYACFGSGPAVILLHGGLGHSGNWGYQVPALTAQGNGVVLIDARGHGRSTRDAQPYTYELMATDVLAVMSKLDLETAALVGWSDGACVALVLAHDSPERARGVFFFGCNMDSSGARPVDEADPVIGRCFRRHVQDYAQLSPTPDQFNRLLDDVALMQRTQPNYSAKDLRDIRVPVTIAQAENDEFIKREHAEYLARTIPNGTYVLLPGVSHFAPLQHPQHFNATVVEFLSGLPAKG
jgi:pimeloyl-ACP methyl ester carboxylesterase